MKIALVTSPLMLKKAVGDEWMPSPFSMQHLGLGYIGAYLEKEGHKVKIYECPAQNINTNTICKELIKENFDAIGLTTYYYNYIYVKKIVKRLRAKQPNVFLFAGGYLPTLTGEKVIEDIKELDCSIIGEGEETCAELFNLLSDGQDWHSIKGICFKKDDDIVTNPIREPIKDLDTLPYPKRIKVGEMNIISMITCRGCYGKCTFCGARRYYEVCNSVAIRSRSPQNVVNEIEFLVNNYNPHVLLISDDVFLDTSKRRERWLEEFYTLMKDRGLKPNLKLQSRAKDVIKYKDYLMRLKEVGLYSLYIGIESLIERQLKFYNKSVTVEENLLAIKAADEIGVKKFGFGFMLLDPDSSIDEVIQTVRLLRDHECYRIVTTEGQRPFSLSNIVNAYPGTDLYDMIQERGLAIKEEPGYRFVDEKTTILNEILKLWRKRLQNIIDKRYLIIKSEELGLYELAKNLNSAKRELMTFDLDFLEELCIRIKDNQVTLANAEQYLDKWDSIAQPIHDVFNQADIVLNGIENKKSV